MKERPKPDEESRAFSERLRRELGERQQRVLAGHERLRRALGLELQPTDEEDKNHG
ncbi:hypothetical protein BH20ACT24_BH20ACT24_16160 [soil metagenome]